VFPGPWCELGLLYVVSYLALVLELRQTELSSLHCTFYQPALPCRALGEGLWERKKIKLIFRKKCITIFDV